MGRALADDRVGQRQRRVVVVGGRQRDGRAACPGQVDRLRVGRRRADGDVQVDGRGVLCMVPLLTVNVKLSAPW